MGQRNTVNIVNFVRGVEPRNPRDLYTPVSEEIKLNKKYGFENTFLLQYDAILRDDFKELFKKEKDGHMEIGIWIEVVRPLTEKVGIEWRGRPGYDWDWYVNPGFLPAYTQKQRELLIDEIIRLFYETFGYYPKSAGSWILDAYSMKYMSEKYGMSAFCICREQFAVDAYTLWGGYYNQGYYPSEKNMLCPAQTEEYQINTPVFRMLGIDPIYCYDEKHKMYPRKTDGPCTLEPVFRIGQEPQVIQWMFDNYFCRESLGFAYVQLGQENSFGWEAISKGLPKQLEMIDVLSKCGKVTVEKLCDTGEWFRRTYKNTPATSLCAMSDREDNGIKSVWYNCKNYRANLFLYKDRLYFRDIFKFDESFEERYLKKVCEGRDAVYENLPVVDGRLWNDDNTETSLAFDKCVTDMSTERKGENSLAVKALCKDGKQISVEFDEKGITAKTDGEFTLTFRRGTDNGTEISLDGNRLQLVHRDKKYSVLFNSVLEKSDKGYTVCSDNGKIAIGI